MASLQTIQKIGPVLDLFMVNQSEWGVSEVAAAIGIPRSSAHALLSSLVETGLLQCRGRGRYRIGWRVVEMNQTLQGTVDVRSCASPVIQALSEKYGETVHLAVMERHRSCRHTPLEMRRSVRQTGPAAAVSDTEPIPGPGAKPAA